MYKSKNKNIIINYKKEMDLKYYIVELQSQDIGYWYCYS